MLLRFSKYQGAGNDFVISDCITVSNNLSNDQIARLCDRRMGVGADGYIEIHPSANADFEMRYFNADGNLGSMCGNGARCALAFAKKMGVADGLVSFIAFDGHHTGESVKDDWIKISINDVNKIEEGENSFFIDNGSPHYIRFVNDIDNYPVFEEGKKIRCSKPYALHGTNVNFVELKNGEIHVRTYERGVEDETLACGTGVTAVALVVMLKRLLESEGSVVVKARGGILKVHAQVNPDKTFSSIFLEGPANFVFSGEIEL